MAELRYDPFTKDYIMVASHRQNRPQMPKNWCPFCPGSGKVPDEYDVLMYENDFPSLSTTPPVPDKVDTSDIFKVKPSYGRCEVILYSPDHTATLPDLSVGHIEKIVNLWCQRFEHIKKDKNIKFIYIFENRGEMIGVTMPHPHGQIYGFSRLPKKLEIEVGSSSEYYKEKGECLFCHSLEAEMDFEERILFRNDAFTVYLPFYAPYPYGVNIISNRHMGTILDFSKDERVLFAQTLKNTTGMLDSLFDKPFPYMMCMHNAPVNIEDISQSFHFHVEFYSPVRNEVSRQYDASSETGAWGHCNQSSPEEKAKELRAALNKFLDKNK